ncbi:MAG: DNA repair protein RecO [Acidobacteria bacterium]|nr:DNA repair protein RecO [Acidobacteriota bacterium]NIM62135.1 DNA repair protein RecO [Acidobacteriota bacterium]NIO59789.1 DNA repair protein RecO [Acidobacteriota bacterium]NIQ30872.1 DNA repair protein RecO [Acidobacteriota bacterium]NIQ85945.1 DNA repair protein RecO [Acidobacteriota bacterium]
MQQADEAFVLRTQPLGDADLIISFLARSHGCVRGVARSGRRSRKRFGGLLEPMTHVEATWSVKSGRELHRIERLEARRSYAAMQADPALQAVCAVMAEIGEAFGAEGAADDREFRLFGAVLDALEGGAEPLLLLRYFEFWTLRLHGLLGDPEDCAACGSSIPRGRARALFPEDGFRCDNCARGSDDSATRLTRDEALWMERLQRTPPGRLPAASGAAKAGGRLERLFRSRLEAFSERRFRSYRHVRNLTGGAR